MKTLSIVIFLVLPFSSGFSQSALVLEGGTLIDGTGGVPVRNSAIIISGGKIIATGKTGKIKAPKGAKKINLKGKFIIPGLTDANACYDSPKDMVQLLAWGVTSANLTLGSAESALRLERGSRDESNHYPRITVTAPVFAGKPGWWRGRELVPDSGIDPFPSTPQDAKETVRKLREMNIGRICILYDSMAWCRSPLPPLNHMRKDVMAALIREARANGMSPYIMTAGLRDAFEAVDYGPAAFMTGILDKRTGQPFINALEGRGIFFIPDFCLFAFLSDVYGFVQSVLAERSFKSALPDDEVVRFLDPEFYNRLREKHPNGRFVLANLQNLDFNFRKMLKAEEEEEKEEEEDAGGRLSVSVATGSGVWILPGIVMHLEIERMVDAGLTPMQAIEAATRVGARFLGTENETGTIEKGKKADLIVLSGDPLSDIRNTRKIEMIMKEGLIYRHADLINESKR